ncbi:PREDICTED: disks large-associated protein 2 [Myotis brandtii]|uniref:disks large-associated protein 2 n=1 Tax=Myotis brandtii TaxID=109478 RepID=UPI0007046687|nr:PREDICTED: disks large-associated protein 2 [Myotis brandtii]
MAEGSLAFEEDALHGNIRAPGMKLLGDQPYPWSPTQPFDEESPEPLPGPFGDLSLKTSKSNNDVKCSACEGLALTPDAKYMKRSSWSTLTVSQAQEAYRKSSLNLDKPLVPPEIKPSLRPCHYLQVPQDEWAGYPPGGKDEEIPCRRMRSGSYIKAMGDEDSGESDSSPKTSPTVAMRPEPLLKSLGPRPLGGLQTQSYLQAASDGPAGHGLDPSANYNSPKFRSRNQSYMRAVSMLSQASCVSQMSEAEVNGQFESVCESVFGEVESQAMDALDLPGCFRTRSHSYLRAIQAGYSQDDECLPALTPSHVTSTIRSTAGGQSAEEGSADTATTRLTRNKSSLASPNPENHALTGPCPTVCLGRRVHAILASKAEEFLRSRLTSIGVQVETATDSDTESRGLREYHSVGVQVEDEKRDALSAWHGAVTVGDPADTGPPEFPSRVGSEQHSAGRRLPSAQLRVLSPVTEGRCFSSLEPAPGVPLVLCVLVAASQRCLCLCPAVLGKIRSAVGSAQLLMSQKFQQFYWLCQQNLDPSAMPRPTSQDLAGYWDMLQLSVEDVSMKFDELQQLKLNNWKLMASPERKVSERRPPRGPAGPLHQCRACMAPGVWLVMQDQMNFLVQDQTFELD